jgi:3-oxoacyl-ACP reductase-like protein
MNDATQNSVIPDKTLDQMAADIAAYQPPAVQPLQTPMQPVQSVQPAQPMYTAPVSMNAAPSMSSSEPMMPPVAPAPAPMSAPAPQSTPAPQNAPAPMSAAMPTQSQPAQPASNSVESLEAQNIFELLGVNNGSDADKESFLDELQQVIWEDFLTSDIQLLLTRAELAEVQTIRAQNPDAAKQQEAVVTYLEKLIPDLENIMLEKALELKREMVNERIAGMRSFLAGKPEKLAELTKAEELVRQGKWATVTRSLNSLAAS